MNRASEAPERFKNAWAWGLAGGDSWLKQLRLPTKEEVAGFRKALAIFDSLPLATQGEILEGGTA